MVQTREILEPSPGINRECYPITKYNVLPTPPPLETGGDMQVNLRFPEGPVPFGCESQGLDVRIIRSGEAWPFAIGDDYTHAQAFSNIENGVGFFGGVITSTTPMDTCVISGPGVPNHCEFFYGPGTSTLTVVPINDSGYPFDFLEFGVNLGWFPFFSTVTLRREGETWTRQGDVKSVASRFTPVPVHYRFPGLLTERVHIKVEGQLGPAPPSDRVRYFYCEERTVDLEPGENVLEVLMDLSSLGPFEPVNEDDCREG
jgi:hypothetical protein